MWHSARIMLGYYLRFTANIVGIFEPLQRPGNVFVTGAVGGGSR